MWAEPAYQRRQAGPGRMEPRRGISPQRARLARRQRREAAAGTDKSSKSEAPLAQGCKAPKSRNLHRRRRGVHLRLQPMSRGPRQRQRAPARSLPTADLRQNAPSPRLITQAPCPRLDGETLRNGRLKVRANSLGLSPSPTRVSCAGASPALQGRPMFRAFAIAAVLISLLHPSAGSRDPIDISTTAIAGAAGSPDAGGGLEQSCGPLFHVCPCHAPQPVNVPAFATAARIEPPVSAAEPEDDEAPASVEGDSLFRPPIASST